MPFVTEEIYSNLPIKETELLLNTSYPKYNKKEIFENETKYIDNMLEYITLFRNRKLELGIGKDFKVVTNIKDKLLLNMLKLNDLIVDEGEGISIELYDFKTKIIYDDSKHKEEEHEKNKKEYETLLKSIERRKKLLSNEGYINKAPKNIVDKEREDLSKEEERLNILSSLIK